MDMQGRLLLGIAIAFMVGTAPVAAAELRMLTSWDKTNPAVPLLAEGFARNVEKASNGSIKFVLNGPETVPPFEQLQPVAAGAFQVLFTHGIYHYGTTGLATGLDAVRGTLEERRASGLFEALDKDYQKIGLKVLAVALSAKTGYAFALKAAIGPDGELKGRKIRGTPAYHPLIRMLGGAPVVLPIPEVYTALEKGVIDGAASPVVGLLGVRWHEVAKFVAQPSFGFTHQLFLMNLDAWNRLADGDKKLLLEEARKMEELWYREYDRMAEEEIKQLIAKGATITNLGASQARLNEVWGEGLWDLAEKKSPSEAKELRQIAKAKGLTD
jgi:TRAP-type mannitol/chloroaromatic compound transport system substrate-binding protein